MSNTSNIISSSLKTRERRGCRTILSAKYSWIKISLRPIKGRLLQLRLIQYQAASGREIEKQLRTLFNIKIMGLLINRKGFTITQRLSQTNYQHTAPIINQLMHRGKCLPHFHKVISKIEIYLHIYNKIILI